MANGRRRWRRDRDPFPANEAGRRGKHMALRVLPDAGCGCGTGGVPLKGAECSQTHCLRKKADHQLEQVKAERSGLREGFFFLISRYFSIATDKPPRNRKHSVPLIALFWGESPPLLRKLRTGGRNPCWGVSATMRTTVHCKGKHRLVGCGS